MFWFFIILYLLGDHCDYLHLNCNNCLPRPHCRAFLLTI
ncbi:MAG: hypothetical protein ACI9A7_002471 [Cyclobacteriaceae bacterium]